ncbi:hypothetical protein C3L33_22883, partial [Rhododendron williamsianum]
MRIQLATPVFEIKACSVQFENLRLNFVVVRVLMPKLLISDVELRACVYDGIAWRNTSLSLAAELIDLEPGDITTSFDYLMEKEALIVGTSKGLLLLHNVEKNITEMGGKVEGGVK